MYVSSVYLCAMMMLVSALIIAVLSLILINKKNFFNTLTQQLRLNLPSPKSYPIIGHYHRFQGKNSEDAFVETNEICKEFPEIVKIWQFQHLNIFVNSPELIEKVLMSKSCLQRPLLLLKFFDVNEGLLSSRYDQWTHDRRFMNQYFNPKMVTSYMSSLSTCVNLLITEIKIFGEEEEVDLLPLLEKCALRAVCSTLFGMEVKDQRIDDIYLRTSEIFDANSKTFEAGLKNPLRFIEIFYRMTSNYKKVRSAQHFLTRLLKKMKFEDGNKEESESMLEAIIKNEGNKFTEKQVSEHILTYLNAGLDTTAAHLHYTILFLAMHQEYQEKLFIEVCSLETVDYEAIMKLTFIDQVVKESFRLAPPIFLIGRETIDDFEISPGWTIPAGTSLAINTFVLHRREDIYGKDANKFNPDNFLPENVAQRHPYSFQPFSTGRRNCIGYRFATIFIKLALIHLIKNFKFSTKSKFENLRFKYGMTLKLTKDHLVTMQQRKV